MQVICPILVIIFYYIWAINNPVLLRYIILHKQEICGFSCKKRVIATIQCEDNTACMTNFEKSIIKEVEQIFPQNSR